MAKSSGRLRATPIPARSGPPPPGGVGDADRDAGAAAYAYDPHLEPRLDWRGRPEQPPDHATRRCGSFSVSREMRRPREDAIRQPSDRP